MECKYSTLLQHAAQIIPNLLGKGNTPLLPDINLGRTSAHNGNSRRKIVAKSTKFIGGSGMSQARQVHVVLHPHETVF